MLAYTMVGTTDVARSRKFYDPVFAEMGLALNFANEHAASWGSATDPAAPRFLISPPYNGNPAAAGNGTMTAFATARSDTVDRAYQAAMANGGTCGGEPGPRPQYSDGFYAAYVRDPDGNKIALVCYDYRT
jgi:catechol 2,3-dioxygenase-like lactoylglutathione lyase family enzyme